MVDKLIIYDTSNFVDYPIGGQLTSIRNFLTYVSEFQSQYCAKILLVGVTTKKTDIGGISEVQVNGADFSFLPVVYRDKNLQEVKNSLRIQFLKGLFRYREAIPHGKSIVHYIHTPEAFIQIKALHPCDKIAVFSHGNFFNMVKGFRFYKNNWIISIGFNAFLKWMLRKADVIFALDDDSLSKYLKYNQNVVKVNNSIVLPSEDYSQRKAHNPIRLLFVGRLSQVKRVDAIISAVEDIEEDSILTIVGDGEERASLESLVKTDRVVFRGALKPDEVQDEMIQADILIMNSLHEGKPMTIIEAMSFGLPIITTDVGGISELVSFGENAVKTDGSAEQIRNAIQIICDNFCTFSKCAAMKSFDFDYRIVNREIFEFLSSEMKARR